MRMRPEGGSKKQKAKSRNAAFFRVVGVVCGLDRKRREKDYGPSDHRPSDGGRGRDEG
jgi:hypothetical protein